MDVRRAHRAAVRGGDGRPRAGPSYAGLGAVCARHAGGALGRLAVLPARLGFGADRSPQHVHPGCARHWHLLAVQRGDIDCAGCDSSEHARNGLRGVGGDRDTRAGRSGARTAGARADLGCDARAPQTRANVRIARRRRRRRGNHRRCGHSRRRSPACAARRKDSCGWRCRRRPRHGGRVHDHG